MKNSEVIIAHPYKHHVYFLAKGVQIACNNSFLMTPLYKKGVGELLPMLPGGVGKKASGYFYDSLKNSNIYSPNYWQIKKLISFIFGHEKILNPFDLHVAKKIKNKSINPKILITLQDYMPNTIFAAKERGIHVWSDQITNQSNAALSRIAAHEVYAGGSRDFNKNSENTNNEILKIADTITVPSEYCRDGLNGRVLNNTDIHVVPYGANPVLFKSKNEYKSSGDVINVVARANSVRKGGHILLEALELCGNDIVDMTSGVSINIKIIGRYADDMIPAIKKYKINKKISIEAKDYAHSDIPELLVRADLFIMPALSESMSLVCVEAMHVGLPVIVTEYVGVDAVKDGVVGFVCKDDAASLACALKNFFIKPSKWSDFGRASNNFASRLTWDSYENNISKIVKSLL